MENSHTNNSENNAKINSNNPNLSNLGQVHIYYGDGKGKTTAALGLGLRAIGAGKKVAVVQFLKPKSIKTGEIIAAKKYLKNILWLNFGLTGFIIGKKISRSAREEAANGLLAVEKIILQNFLSFRSLHYSRLQIQSLFQLQVVICMFLGAL